MLPALDLFATDTVFTASDLIITSGLLSVTAWLLRMINRQNDTIDYLRELVADQKKSLETLDRNGSEGLSLVITRVSTLEVCCKVHDARFESAFSRIERLEDDYDRLTKH
jgi:hypothetical protein